MGRGMGCGLYPTNDAACATTARTPVVEHEQKQVEVVGSNPVEDKGRLAYSRHHSLTRQTRLSRTLRTERKERGVRSQNGQAVSFVLTNRGNNRSALTPGPLR